MRHAANNNDLDAMLGRKWKPKYFSSANNSHPSVDDLQTSSVEVRPIPVSSPANENNVERPPNAPKRKKKSKVSPQLSTKGTFVNKASSSFV